MDQQCHSTAVFGNNLNDLLVHLPHVSASPAHPFLHGSAWGFCLPPFHLSGTGGRVVNLSCPNFQGVSAYQLLPTMVLKNFTYAFLGGAFRYVAPLMRVSGGLHLWIPWSRVWQWLVCGRWRLQTRVHTLWVSGALPQFLAFAQNVLD